MFCYICMYICIHCNLIVNNRHYFLLFTLVPESFDMSYIERDVLYVLFLQFLREDLLVVYLKNCLFLLKFRKCFLVCTCIVCGIRTNGIRTIGTLLKVPSHSYIYGQNRCDKKYHLRVLWCFQIIYCIHFHIFCLGNSEVNLPRLK